MCLWVSVFPPPRLNGGGRGDKAHSLDEWYEHVNAWQGPQTILLTTLRLSGTSWREQARAQRSEPH